MTRLFCSLSGATALRELSTELLAWQKKVVHIGIKSSPRRFTISDGNSKRPSVVFRDIYIGIFLKNTVIFYRTADLKWRFKKLFIVASTVISLFKDTLKVAGKSRKMGRVKVALKPM